MPPATQRSVHTGMLCLVLLPLWAGCLPVLFAYPKIESVPKAEVNSDQGDVHAFLLTTTYAEKPGTLSPESLRRRRPQTLAPLPLSSDGRKVSHKDFHFEASALVVGALNYGWSYGRHTEAVVYRPGYKLVRVHPGEKKGKIPWEEVASPAARERVIDELLALDTSHPYNFGLRLTLDDSQPEAPLAVPAQAADKPVNGDSANGMPRLPGQREVMLFAADQYERLATLLEADARGKAAPADGEREEAALRLRVKSQWLNARVSAAQ
jgi:hypothetical protein